MDNITRKVMTRVLTEQYAFLTASDVGVLLLDPATRELPTLLRFQCGRTVTPLHTAVKLIEADRGIFELRDVSFPSDTARKLASELGVEIGAA